MLDDLAGFSAVAARRGRRTDILGHVFGPRRPKVESDLGRASGIDPATMAKVMALLAPIVMAMLGKAKNSRGLDPDGVASTLGQERSRLEQSSPSGMDALGKMLDADGDGSFLDDLAEQGGGLLGSLFKRVERPVATIDDDWRQAMGLFDFVRDAGEKIFGKDDKPAPPAKPPGAKPTARRPAAPPRPARPGTSCARRR